MCISGEKRERELAETTNVMSIIAITVSTITNLHHY